MPFRANFILMYRFSSANNLLPTREYFQESFSIDRSKLLELINGRNAASHSLRLQKILEVISSKGRR